MKFRKKPVVIDAVQFFAADTSTHINVNFGTPTPEAQPHLANRYWCGTLEGPHEVSEGDWIITGVKGEIYPCKPDIFDATYERADIPGEEQPQGRTAR